MKKVLFLSLSIIFIYILYEAIGIYILLEKNDETIGSTRIYDKNNILIAELSRNGGYALPYSGSLDEKLIQDIIQVEDKWFREHNGIEIQAKLASLYQNYQAWKIIRWGSTLTEQFIKNAYFADSPRTLTEKIKESFWASILEMRFSKDEILRKYLDTIYMGNGIYGIQAAIDFYFWKDIHELTDEEIIEIITRIHSPNLGEWSKEYKNIVSHILFNKDSPNDFESRNHYTSKNTFPLLTSRIQEEISLYCSWRENSLIEFMKSIPGDICSSAFLSLSSTVDADLIKFSEDTLEGILEPLEEKNVKNWAIYIYSPKEKKILSYIGNRRRWNDGNAIDMITKRRSVWSILKPFVYLMALENGSDGESLILDDTKIYMTDIPGKDFLPENYIPKSYGPIPLREALWNSLNSATVRLSESIGIGRIYDFYKKSWINLDHDSWYYGYGISLGWVDLSLENIVHAYVSLVDISDPSRFLLYDILSDSKNRARTFGVSSILNTSIPFAVKTGTSTDFHDNWAIGYNNDAIIGIWVGNADGSPMNDVSWVSGAWPIFHHIAEYMIKIGMIDSPNITLPQGIIESSICLDIPCNQKVLGYTREWGIRKSRPKNNLYFESDFITSLTLEEKKKWKIQ